MPTATLKLSHQNTQTYNRTLIDSGLQRSFICAKLANKLKLPVVGTVNVNLSTFGTDPTPQVFHVVRAKMQIGSRRFMGKLIIHDNINTEIVSPGIHKVVSMLANKGINLADCNVNSDKLRNGQLLIGVDYFNQIVISQKKVYGVNSFVTPGGLIPFGPLPAWSRPAISYDEFRLYCNRVLCESPLESLWGLETIGISTERFAHDEKIAVSSVVSEMEQTAQGYVVKLPFKSDERPTNNWRNAHVQLNSLLVRCKKDVELFEQYNNVIKEYKEKKFIEEVDPTDYSGCFLPHHPVFKESATTQLRIVFNASSYPKGGGKSLNDCLYAGPSLTTKLHDLLLTFRSNSFAVISDI